MNYAITGKIRYGKASLTWLEQKDGSFKLPITSALIALLSMGTNIHDDESVSYDYKIRIVSSSNNKDLGFDYLKRSENFTSKEAPDLLSWGSSTVIETVMELMKDHPTWN